MFRKVQCKLTLWTGGVIAVILLAAAVILLSVSRQNLIDSRMMSYHNDLYTIASYLTQQDVVTHKWLASLTRSGYLVSLTDNGTPFLYNALNEEQTALSEDARAAYDAMSDSLESTIISYECSYCEFTYTSPAGEPYYAFLLTCGTDRSLELLLLSPALPLQAQIRHQSMLIFGIISAVFAALCVLDYLLIGRLLAPIEESRRRQSRFVAAASHELRTPLAVILSCTEDMEERRSQDSLGVVHDEALRMSRLLADLLTLSAQEAGAGTLQLEPVAMDTLVLNASETFEAMARQKGLHLSVTLPSQEIPAICCDRAQIEQLLSILLHNAISYTPEGGSIALSLSCDKNTCTIAVADSGAGIPDEEKSKIFDSFYRSERARSTKGHFGLGLSIAKGIADAHGAALSVRDREGGGSVFEVRFKKM